MLGRMLIHGLVAAVLVGSAAAVYAQVKDNGYLAPVGTQTGSVAPAEPTADNGYLVPSVFPSRERHDDGRHDGYRSDRHRDRFDRKRDRDDDDD